MSKYDPSLASTTATVGGESSSAPTSKLEESSRSEAIFITAAWVGPAHPDQWRDLKYGFRLRAFRSKANNREECEKVKEALSTLSKVAVRKRQEAFKSSCQSNKNWSQMCEESMWIDTLTKTALKLEPLMGVSLKVKSAWRDRPALPQVFVEWGESEYTDDPSTDQTQASWFTEAEIKQAAKGELLVDALTETMVKETTLSSKPWSPECEDWMLVDHVTRR